MAKSDLTVARITRKWHLAHLLKYYPRPPCTPSLIKSGTLRMVQTHFLLFWNSLYVYTRGILGCLLGFWPLGQNPAGAVKKLLLLFLYIKQIDSMLLCVCSVIDHRRRQNVVRTLVTHSAITSCASDVLTTFWRHLWSINEQTHDSMESIC